MVCSEFMLDRALLLVTLFLIMLRRADGEERLPLRILGLFPYRGSSWNGEYVIPAARLAIDEINNNTDILPGYKLELIEANSECSRDPGLRTFVSNAIHSEHVPVAILGPGCSSSSIPIASVAGRDKISIPQLSYGATSVFLSFAHSYPYFYRTVPTDVFTTIARVKLMEVFNWKRYGIHNSGVGDTNQVVTDHAITSLRVEAERHIPDSVEVYRGESLTSVDRDYYRDQLPFTEDMIAARMRIGMLHGSQRNIGNFFCFLYRHNLIYPQVVWMLANQGGRWYNTSTEDCSVEEIRQATHGAIHFNYQLNTSDPNDIINVTNKTFTEYYKDYINEVRKYAIEVNDYNASSDNTLSLVNNWATVAYDSMWTLGLALHKADRSLNDQNLSLVNSSLGSDAVSLTTLRELEKISFNGASGVIQFDKEHKREMTIAIHQVQHGRLVRIGSYFPSQNTPDLGKLDLDESALLWSLDNPPLDDFTTETIRADEWAVILMWMLLVIGFIWNSFSLVVNFCYQHFHSIKASCPPLNHMIFAGNYTLLLSGTAVVIQSMREHDTVTFTTLCWTRNWLFDLGLLLLLNTTLLKSWRIYYIFHSFSRKHNKMITDNVFVAITAVVILLNTLYHLVFVLLNDRSIAKEMVLPLDGQVRQRIVYCSSFDLWGIFYLPHIGIGVVLCLLAFSIRKVKLKQFNDAPNIAIFFYATTPVAGICETLSFIFSPANNEYSLVTASLILSCVSICSIVYMCQLTLFVPKMLPLFGQWYMHYCHR